MTNEQSLTLNYHVIFFVVWENKIKVQTEKHFYASSNIALINLLSRKDLKKFDSLVIIEGAVSKSFSVLGEKSKILLTSQTTLEIAKLIQNVSSLIDVKSADFLNHLRRIYPSCIMKLNA